MDMELLNVPIIRVLGRLPLQRQHRAHVNDLVGPLYGYLQAAKDAQ